MIRDIINPTIDNLIKSIIRLPYEILQVVTKGFPVYYTRKDVGYSVDISDNEIECVQDQPLFEYVDGEHRFLQYDGENLCKVNGVAVDTLNINAGAMTKSFTADGFYRVENNTGSGASGSITGTTANTNLHSWKAYARSSTDVSGPYINLAGGTLQRPGTVLKWIGQEGVTPSTSSNALFFVIPDGEWLEFKYPQLTETPYNLPTIPGVYGARKTVNSGTLQVLAEHINTRAFYFDGSSCVNADLLTSADIDSIEFYCRLASASGECLTMCPNDTDSAVVAVASGSGFVINFTDNGSDYISTTELAFNTNHHIKIDVSGNLYVDDILQTLAAGSNYVYSSTDILFGHNGLSNYLTGYMWGMKINGNDSAYYLHPGDRQDDVAPDSSGNGLHGKIVSDDVMGVRAENLGFGYPVAEKAHRPFTSALGTKYGVAGLLTGADGNNAVGSLVIENHQIAEIGHNLVTNGTFDSADGWTLGTGWSIAGGVASCDGSQTANTSLRQDNALNAPLGKTYAAQFDVLNRTLGSVRCNIGGYTPSASVASNGTYKTTPLTVKNTESSENIYIIGDLDFTGSVDNFDLREVNVLAKTEDGTPLVYIDPFDGYVKMTDGTNTAVSPSVVTPGVEYSVECALSSTTMQINKDGVEGTPVTFTGGMPDLGNRVFLLDSNVYQTCREIYFVEDGDLI